MRNINAAGTADRLASSLIPGAAVSTPGNMGTVNSRLSTVASLTQTTVPGTLPAAGIVPAGDAAQLAAVAVLNARLIAEPWYRGFTLATVFGDPGMYLVCTCGYPLSDPHARVARIDPADAVDPAGAEDLFEQIREEVETLHAAYGNRYD